ncbi:hypothetical protein [Nostoc sp. C110]|uniref:hypothetical protein n=1 Tax=Nostoc sp. C110 TaxID=3349876 RepID=UPI00370D42CA
MVFAIFGILISTTAIAEYQGNPAVNALSGSQQTNLEGKSWLGWAETTLFATSKQDRFCINYFLHQNNKFKTIVLEQSPR